MGYRVLYQGLGLGGAAANGRAALIPYVWRRGDAERDAQVAAQVAAIRARARAARVREIIDARNHLLQ